MANDKKFIVKNGLQSEQNVVIGSTTDNGTDKLQVTGSAKVTGTVEVTQASQSTPTVKFTNTGGPSSLVAEFAGTSESIQISNVTPGDYTILNTGQDNGIKLYNNAAGMELLYNGSVDLSFNSVGIDFKREPSYQGSIFWNAGNDGAGSGLDADLIDGLDSLQFVRADEDDTLDGNYTITGNLTVQGTTTTVNSETVLIADNLLTLNSNFSTGAPTENAGWEVLRGDEAISSLQWDETNDWFKLISDGVDLGRIITTADEGSGNGFDADTVDGLEAAQFLRADADDTATGNITIEGNLTVGDGNGTSFLYMDGAGSNGILASTAGEIGFLNSAFNFALKVKTDGDIEVRDDIFAQKFIDINDNDYEVIPSGISTLNNIDLAGGLRKDGDTATFINFPAASQIGFTLGNTQYGLMNTTAFTYVGDMTANRFVDRNDNSYLVDPSGASTLGTVGIDSDLYHNGDTDTKLSFGTNTIGLTAGNVQRVNVGTTVDLYNTGVANNALNVGISATERFNIDVTDSQGYIRYIQDETDATDHSVNFEIISSGIGLNKFKFNKDIDVGSNTVGGGFGNFSSGVYASKFYDYDDETYFGDFNNTGTSLKIAGAIHAGDGSSATPSYTFGSDTNTGMFRGAADRLDFAAGSNVELQIFTSYALAPGSFRSPIFYDSGNTGYYGNFNGTSQMSRIDIDDYIRHRGDTDTYFGFGTNDTFRVWTNGTQRLNIDADSADFAQNIYAPRYYDSGDNAYYLDPAADSQLNTVDIDDYIRHRGDTNTYIGFDGTDRFKVWTNGTQRLNIDNDSADFAQNVFAPRFYTNDYLVHNGDTNTYIGFDAADQFGVWTDGTKRVNVTASSIDLNLNTSVTGNLTATGRAVFGNSLTRPDSLADLSNSAARIGGSDVHLHIASLSATGNYAVAMQSGRDSDDSSFPLSLNPNGGFVGVGTTGPTSPISVQRTAAMGNNPFAASNRLMDFGDGGNSDFRFAGDSGGNAYLVTDNNFVVYDESASGKFAVLSSGDVIVNNDSITYAQSDATPATGTIAANKLHVSGSVSLAGANDAIVFGNGTSSYLKDEELGFGWGGGLYMTEATTMYVRGNKALYTTGNITGARFYDGSDANYYLDPAGDSQLNTIDIDDYIRHRGDTNTYIGFSAADTVKIFTGGSERVNIDNDSANFAQNVYAPRYYDSNNNAYYLDPASTSVLNDINIDDWIRHNGNTDAYFGFASNNNYKLFTNGVERFNVDANSADFSVNVYAPRYYDSNDTLYYVDPASTSRMNNVTFGVPGNGANTKGRFISIEGNTDSSGEGSGRIFFAEHNSTAASQDRYGMSLAYQGGSASINSVTGQPVTLAGTSNGVWALIGHDNSVNGNWAMRGPRDSSYVEARGSFRAPLFYDSNNTAYYTDPASTSVMNVVRANQIQIDGSTYTIDSPSGDYGSIKVDGAKGGWAGYVIRDDWAFISSGSGNAGIYNDTRNEWSLLATDNNSTVLYSNGVPQLSAENGYSKAYTSMRSPIYYPPSGTTTYLDLDAGNTSAALRVTGVIDRTGFSNDNGQNNRFLTGQDYNHWIWNTATNWGIHWATNTSATYRHSPFGDNMITFVGAGNVRAAIDLDSGNAYFQNEVTAGDFALNGGGENISLNPQYGSGLADTTLFDGTEYWDKRNNRALRGNESNNVQTSEYAKNGNGPFASSYVVRTSAYRVFYSDYILVEPGEEIYGEMWTRVISGSGGRFYYGIERFDKDKRPIGGNTGTTYFVAGGPITTSTNWQKFSAYTTIPTTHTAYNGSDGAGVKYIRMRILMNHSTGGALREYGPPILKRVNHQSKLATDESLYVGTNATIVGDLTVDDITADLVDANSFRDRSNTGRYMDPVSGASVAGTWNFNNGSITNVNNITIADPGPNEGITWNGGSGWKIYESPDNLTTNSGGNLQIVQGSTSRARFNTSGDVVAGRYMDAQRFRDSNNVGYYADPASTSIFNTLTLRTGGLQLERTNTNNAIWFNAGTDANHVLWNHYQGGPGARGAAGSGGFDGMKWNTYAGLHIQGGLSGAYDIAKFHTTGSGSGNAHYVQLYANNVEQLGTRGGYGFAPNSMRSPIFYDSNDAAYYGDFASTSRMNVINANMYSLNDGWDIYDDDSDTLSIRSNNSDHGEIIFRDSNSTNCGRIYFDDDSHWGFKSPDNEWQIYLERNAAVNLYYNNTWEERSRSGYMEARGSYRAPIFYDSNNTAYRIDGNGTSRLLTLNVDNVIGGSVNGYASQLLRKDNRTIEPNDDAAGRLTFGFTSWNNDNSSPYADYLHLRSYTDASGGSDNLVTFKKSGIGMRIWQQAFNSGSVYSTYRNVAVYNENPGASNDLYASIFYDSNDTSFRVDPTGRSQIRQLDVGSNVLSSTYTNAAIEVREYNYAGAQSDNYATAPRISFHWGNRVASQIAMASSGEIRIINNPGNATESFRAFNVSADGSMYGQRYYDSNNTTYYADPASTSVFNSIDNRGEIYNDGWFRNDTGGRGMYSTPYAQHWMAISNTEWKLYGTGNTQAIRFSTSGDNTRGYVYADNSNNIGFLNQSGSWALRTNGGTTEVYGNLYANIMYDRNSTGYYVNPASQSHMNTLTLQGNRLGFVNSSFDAEIRVTDDNPDGTGATFVFYGDQVAYNAEVATEVFRATRHIRAPRYYDSNNSAYYVDPASTSIMSTVQADIFYDRNNTAYYWNGASTNSSRFLGVNNVTMAYMALPGHTRESGEYYRARPRQTSDTNYWTGSMGWGRVDMNVVSTWGSGFIDSWSNPANQPSGTSHWVGTQAYHYRNSTTSGYGWQMVGGPIENLRFRSSWAGWRSWRTIPVLGVNSNNNAAMYANIYYDSDNTGYYCDPSSFSNLNSGVRATEFYARNWFRNDNSREGMYNQATGAHSYSYQAQYWAITGNNNSSSMSLQLRAANNGTMCRWMYGDRTWSGDLNAAGQWQLQTRHQDGYSPTLRFIESGNESWTGNIGNDAGKIEYHSNRFYIESGGNSTLICQFRRNGSNRSYVDNNGLYVGTATSARWADLAERYSADAIYENATVLGVNLDGDSEATLWQPGMPLLGVISTNPAVQMNDMGIAPGSTSKKAKMNPFIALKGRIPCKVSEPVRKGQWVIPAGDGKAKGVDYGTPGVNSYEIIGIALSDSENGEVEVKV